MSKNKKKTASIKSTLPSNNILFAIIIMFSFLLYGNTLQNDYGFDDKYNTPINPTVAKGFDGFYDIFTKPYIDSEGLGRSGGYRPIPMATFAIEYELFGKKPNISHAINTILYAFCGIILFLLLQILLQSYHSLLPFLITILFLAHPIHTEVVASLKNREELLSFLFAILAALLFIKYFENKKILHFIFAFFCFMLGMLSKSGTIIFALLIPLMLYFFRPKTNLKQQIALSAFLIILPILSLALVNMSFEGEFESQVYPSENPLALETNFFTILATSFYALGYYLRLLFAPFPLLFYYGAGKFQTVGFGNIWAILSAVIHILAGLWALKELPKKHILSFAILFYLIGIGLYSNILVRMPGVVAERLAFSASLGFCFIVIYALFQLTKASLTQKIDFVSPNHKRLIAIVGLLLLPCIFLTIQRNAAWKNTLTLLENDISHLEKAPVPQYLYANQLVLSAEEQKDKVKKEKYARKAIKHFEKSLKLQPKNASALRNAGYTTCQVLGQPAESIPFFEASLALSASNFKTHYEAAKCYRKLQNAEKSLYHFEKYIVKKPNDFETKAKMIGDYCGRGELAKADKLLADIKAAEPNSKQYHLGAGTLNLCKSDTVAATQNFEQVIKISPNNTQQLAAMVAMFYLKQGNTAKYQYYMQMSKR
ncbi:MAG: hypothetical protein ACPG5B_05585 [Chitinophagales bacterium]